MTALFGLACPIDGSPLAQMGNSLRCSQGHHFDIARQGYVNLLPVQFKRSKQPGDSKEMVRARTHFLNLGYFQPIAQELNQRIISSMAQASEPMCFLDAGCGDGYYLAELDQALKAHLQNTKNSEYPQLIGLDISKWAIQAACKRNKNITWVVGTNKHLPVPAHSLDCIICGFGFPHFPAFATALKSSGYVMTVEAGPNHLIELRHVLYESIKPSELSEKETSNIDTQPFELTQQQPLSYKIASVPQTDLNVLMEMTPHYYRAQSEGIKAARALSSLDITIDVIFKTYCVMP